MPDRRVFNVVLAGFDRSHHHLARVYPDPRLKRQFALDPQPIRVALEVLLHP